MGQHKHNPNCQLKKEGKLPPKPKRIGKRAMERELYAMCAGYIGKRLLDAWKPNEVLNEFLERLSIYVIPQKREGYNSDIVLKSTIDSLVKEMTEVQNAPHNNGDD